MAESNASESGAPEVSVPAAELAPRERAALEAENRVLRERVRQLEARQASSFVGREDWMLRFFEGIPQGLVKVDLSGAVRFANVEAQRFLGLSWSELEQRYVTDFAGRTWHEDGTVCPIEDYPVSRCLMSGQPQPAAMIGVELAGGEVNWAIFTAIPTFVDACEGHTGALVVFVDVTDMQRERVRRRAAEAHTLQARKLESIGALAGGVAHDMNNILAVISGMAFVLGQQPDDVETRTEALEAILRSCRRGRDLVRNLLGFARQGTRERHPVDLNAVVDEVAALLSRTLPEGIELECETATALPPVMGDPSELTTMLMNLCINAADAVVEAEHGGPRRIVLSTRLAPCIAPDGSDPNQGDCVHLVVSDTGCGIPESALDKVFEPFFTTKPPGRGTGLGLSMVYGTVQTHGGNVHIDSQPGRGTTIVIDLPALALDGIDPATLRRPTSSSDSLRALVRDRLVRNSGRLRVLVVEDDPDVLVTTTRIVEMLGHEALTAASGEAAIAALRGGRERVDVAVLDMRLPDMHGEQIFVELRSLVPSLPVVLTTGHADEERVRRTLERGALAMLRKPLDVRRLRELFADLVVLGAGP